MAIEKNIVIGADLSGIEVKLNELIDLLKNSQTEADKTSKSVEQVADEVKEVGKSAKEGAKGVKVLSNGIRGIGLALKAAGIGLLIEGFQLFKDVLKSNQGVTDTFAVTLQTLVFAFNGIIKAVSSGDFLSIPKVLSEAREQAIELVALQNEIALKEAKRSKLQVQSLINAEKQRQFRDDETKSLDSRIEANEKLNSILKNQILEEQAIVQLKVDAANKELLKNNNIVNQVALLEAETEMLEIQERLEGQMSEYQMNRNSLQREFNELKLSEKQSFTENSRAWEDAEIERMANRNKAAKIEKELSNERFLRDKRDIEDRIAILTEGTQEYQDLQSELSLKSTEWYNQQMALEQELAQIKRDNIQKNFDLASQGLGALQALNDAFAKDDEASAKKSFKINKALGISQAVVSTAMAVTAALTAGGNPLKLATGQQFVEAGIAAAAGAAQIATISKQQFGGGAGGTSSVPQPSASTAPSFNLVGSTGDNAILESLRNNPVKAYVVGSDVTSQQQLDRNRINQVSFP
jgi:hypothetical protein